MSPVERGAYGTEALPDWHLNFLFGTFLPYGAFAASTAMGSVDSKRWVMVSSKL